MSPALNMGLPPRLSSERFRYQQPKRFWLALFAGSVGLHLAVGLVAPMWWRSLSPKSTGTGTTPTPVELIDVSEVEGVALNDAAAPADPAITGVPSLAGDPVAPPSTAVPLPAPTDFVAQPVPQPFTPQPSPSFSDPAPSDPVPSDPAPVLPQPPADFPNTPDPAPLPQEPLPSQNAPVEQPQPDQGLPSGFPQTDPSVVVGNPLPPPGDVPNPSDWSEGTGLPGEDADVVSGGGEGTSGDLMDVGTPQQAPSRGGLASLTPGSSSLADVTADAPEVPPQPVQTSLEFISDPADPNSCLITPDSEMSFGEQVSLRLVIGTDGQVIDAFEEGSSINPAYVELVRCVVLRNWTFTPATTGGIAQQSNLLVTLSIQATP